MDKYCNCHRTRLFFIYIVGVLLLVVASYLHVQGTITSYNESLKHFELTYIRDSPEQSTLVNKAMHLGMKTINVTELSNTGITRIVLPRLKKSNDDKTIVIEGLTPVEDMFGDIQKNREDLNGGVMAVVIIMTYVLVGVLSKSIITIWSPVAPMATIFSVSVLYQFCTTCHGNNQ